MTTVCLSPALPFLAVLLLLKGGGFEINRTPINFSKSGSDTDSSLDFPVSSFCVASPEDVHCSFSSFGNRTSPKFFLLPVKS